MPSPDTWAPRRAAGARRFRCVGRDLPVKAYGQEGCERIFRESLEGVDRLEREITSFAPLYQSASENRLDRAAVGPESSSR